MTLITVQIGSTLGFLGRADMLASGAKAGLAQVNGAKTSHGDLGLDHANSNDLPQARPETGLLGSTRVATPGGQTAVQDLKPGDLVLDPSGATVAVRHILKTPTAKTAIRIRAPYFGLDQDLVVGPDHRIAVTSDIAEYLFGAETVLVPTWALKDGRKAQHWEMAPKTDLYQVQLEHAAALSIGKCAVESMPKSGQSIGKILSEEEARCFASEHKSGYQS
jgi:hypothetical protein